jgi:hypothetical protein
MKLNSAQLGRTLGQFEAHAIPDDHPVIPQLNDLFQRLVRGTHVLARQPRAQHRGAGRGRGVRYGRESGQLE